MLINELKRKLEQELASTKKQQPKDNSLERLIAGKFVSLLLDSPKNSGVSYQQHLENDTKAVQSASEGGNPMAYKRERVRVGTDADGKPKYVQVSGDNQDERNDNIVRAILASPRRAEFVTDAIVQTKPEEQPKELHQLDKVVKEYCEVHYIGKGAERAYQDRKRLERIIKFFGDDKAIEELTMIDIQRYLDTRAEGGIKYSTLRDEKEVLKQLFQYAEDSRLIEYNIIDFARVKNNGAKGKTRKAATVKQWEDIVANIPFITDPILRLCVAIEAYTAIRPEELLGLKWEDIDFDKKIINIQRAVTYPAPKRHRLIKDTKTAGSADWIPAVDDLMVYLEAHKTERGWIVHDGTGEPFINYAQWWAYWGGAKTNIELYGQRACEFRKTVISVLLAKGADPKSVQRLARHANIQITLDVYAEVDPDAFKESCNKLNNVKNA